MALAWGALLFFAATILPLFRQTGARSWQTIWAEDGFEYFEQAHKYGGLSVLLRGYGGYLQLPPRLLAVVSTSIPIHELSIYMALSGTFVGALLALFTYHVSEEWIASRSMRLALATLVVLMPVLGAENTANITNLIWVFAAVAPLALISTDEHPGAVVARSAVVFLAASSTSLCFLFLPLAIGFVVLRRTWATGVVATVFAAGLTLQAAVVLHTKDIVSFIPKGFLTVHRTLTGITDATGLHVFATFLIGTSTNWLAQHDLLVYGSIILFVAITVFLLRGAERQRQLVAVVFVAYALITFVAPVWSRRDAAPRYSVVPLLLLASAVAILIADPTRRGSPWIARIGPRLFVAQVLVVTVIGFTVTTYRSESPRWSASVTSAWELKCHRISSNKVVEVPTDEFNAWPVGLSCRDLSS